MRRLTCVMISLFVLSFVASVHAAQERFTLDSMRKMIGVGSPRISPDGRSVVFVVTTPNFDTDRNEAELQIVDLPAGAPRALTVERHHVSEPRWSPDGSTIAFLAPDKDDNAQIWLLPFRGGEARQFTHSATEVAHFAWRPDGAAIAYAAPDTVAKKTGEARHLKTFDVGAQDLFLKTNLTAQHIWLQLLDGTPARRLTSGTWSLEFALPPSSPPSHLAWSPDGRSIAFARAPAAESGKLDSTSIAVLDVASGAIRPLDTATQFQNHPDYSPDGRSILFWYPRDGRGDQGFVNELYLAPAGGGTAKSVTRALDRMVFNGEWMPDGRTLLVAANDRTTVGLWLQPIGGTAKRLELGDLVINGAFGYDLTVSRKGAIVFSATTGTHPSELYLMESPTTKPHALTHFNDWAKGLALGRTESVTWTNDGMTENGVVVYPPDFDPQKHYPLVLNIHGGPTAASKSNFNPLAQLMASEGWCVLMPNYRGSDNLGNAYQAAIHGDWGAGPGRDVMAGVETMRQRPYIDRERTAVSGWSYGGYMTTWLIGNYPTEWKVAMAGAPVTNWQDEYDLSDGNISLRNDMGGSPWVGDHGEFYRQQSPITYIGKAKTPTLVMANTDDFRVPPTQATALYRSLQDNGVETKFIAFQGRAHASSDPVNARERTRLWVEWIRLHLSPTTPVP
jgi:dipeptidyl aminopeptidase/acylaminoacyl peptidase